MLLQTPCLPSWDVFTPAYVESGGFAYTAYGNHVACILVSGKHTYNEALRSGHPAKILAVLIGDIRKSIGQTTMADLIAAVGEPWVKTEEFKECKECDGSGEVECFHCGGDADCEECDGLGKVEQETCPKERLVKIGDRFIDGLYIANLITLAGPISTEPVTVFANSAAVRLVGDGWQFIQAFLSVDCPTAAEFKTLELR